MSRAIAVLFLAATALSSQQRLATDGPLIRVSVNLVQVDDVVTDREYNIVTDLSPGDFEILQDGKPQKLTRFAYISAQNGEVAAPQL